MKTERVTRIPGGIGSGAQSPPAGLRNERMMAETITLRAYLNDLQGMVDNESPTEVVSHCRYILQHFPQNVATYRLLGKALLQKGHNEGLPEHFVQAADIFQRVLSVLPDDPIAHLALSEIREQEGAVGQAIWHMERAQEEMPGNALIRDALRKLYLRQTGAEGGSTDKLQLSQGALARQYANSQLYDEAILELRRALQAEPDRIDLQVLLAKLLWDSQHPIEAGEVAIEVLERLPYCLEANALMARLWLAYGRPSEAQQFLDRVEALDPYAAMAILRPERGPDPNVLPRLDYTARAAASLSAETPEWVHDLDDIDDLSATYAALGDETGPLGSRGVDEIDTQVVFGEQSRREPPEWAQEFMAAEDEETPEWFSAPSPDERRPASEPAAASWLEGLDEEEARLPRPEPSGQTEAAPGDLPDWFSLVTHEEPEEAQAAKPDWFADLGNAASAEESAPADAMDDPLAWMRDEPEPKTEQPGDAAPDEALAPDWLPFGADAEQPLTLEQWQQTIASEEPANAQEAGGFLADEDEIADLDRLFDALNAAETAGDRPDVVALGAAAGEEPAAPADDWLAIFSEPQPSEESAPEAPSVQAGEPDWGAFDAGEKPDDLTEAPFGAAEASIPQATGGSDEEDTVEAAWRAVAELESVSDSELDEIVTFEREIRDEAKQAPIAVDAEAMAGDLFEQASPVVDEDLLNALSEAADDDWLRPLESGPTPAPEPIVEAAPDDALSEDDIMAIFGEVADDALTEQAEELPLIEQAFDLPGLADEEADVDAAEAAPEEREADWLLTEASDMVSDEHTESRAPAWNIEDVPPAAPAPPVPAEEVAPDDWLAALRSEVAGVDDAFELAESEITERPSLFGLARAVEQAQQGEVPDWISGLEITGAAPEDEELGMSVKDAYDPFEGGDPTNVPAYESAGHTGILQPDEEPDWMRAFAPEVGAEETGVADAENELPDFATADLVDEEPEDALSAFNAAAQASIEPPEEPAPRLAFDGIEWDMPGDDLILGVEPEVRAEADAEVPDWLSAITQSATSQTEDLPPDEEDLFVTGDAATVPDWLREIEEPASDETWDSAAEELDVEALAPAGDLADTWSASPPAPAVEDDFDDTFSFSDREPTWLRRASQWRDDGSESA